MVCARRPFCEWIVNFAPAQTRTHIDQMETMANIYKKPGDRTTTHMRTITFGKFMLTIDPRWTHYQTSTHRHDAKC